MYRFERQCRICGRDLRDPEEFEYLKCDRCLDDEVRTQARTSRQSE